MKEAFRHFAKGTADAVGSPSAFLLAVIITVVWAALGPVYHYSDTWQLAINTGTTIATFLMVFLIQYTQNRDARVVHLKLDELIRAVSAARTELVSMENLSDEQLDKLEKDFKKLHDRAEGVLNQIDESRLQRGKQTVSKE
jgi:low affinity Fe/Cu permease